MSQSLQLQPVARKETDRHNAQLNQSTYDILSLIFEFKIAASWHISRFLIQKDQSKHIYSKLRRMWQGGLLESFKVLNGQITGIPVYYTLSKEALRFLERRGLYTAKQISQYPKLSTVLKPYFFKHDSQIVELASVEAKIIQKRSIDAYLNLTFRGEIVSGEHGYRYDSHREYMIEVFTPDYSVQYDYRSKDLPLVYTEYERTAKSKWAILKKIDRYLTHLSYQDRQHCILRIIFETEGMEMAFWKTVILESKYDKRLIIFTTNMVVIERRKEERKFNEGLYVNRDEVDIVRNGRLEFKAARRIKLFVWL